MLVRERGTHPEVLSRVRYRAAGTDPGASHRYAKDNDKDEDDPNEKNDGCCPYGMRRWPCGYRSSRCCPTGDHPAPSSTRCAVPSGVLPDQQGVGTRVAFRLGRLRPTATISGDGRRAPD